MIHSKTKTHTLFANACVYTSLGALAATRHMYYALAFFSLMVVANFLVGMIDE